MTGQCRALTRRSHSNRPGECLQAARQRRRQAVKKKMPPSTTRYISTFKVRTKPYEMVIGRLMRVPQADHQASHRGANSAPSYNNPLLSAHAINKRRPSGRNQSHQCGKSHERGNCPAYGKTCNKCKGPNHFRAMCHSKVPDRTMQSPYKKKPQQQAR